MSDKDMDAVLNRLVMKGKAERSTIAQFKRKNANKKLAKARRALREAVTAGLVAKHDPWDTLTRLIDQYVGAAIQKSWEGGGDPSDVEILAARLTLARAEMNQHIERMKREFV